MKGFSNRWKDFPDYILGITEEIWEGRGIHLLHDYYAEDIPVRLPGGLSMGRQATIDATRATQVEFPDRTLLGEDVIWSGTPETGMLSSHRIVSTATHLGDGPFGPPTGKKVKFRAIADCHAKNNVIDDEWLVRDSGAICRQIGMTPEGFARRQIANDGGPGATKRPFTPDQDVAGPYNGRGNDNEWGAAYTDILQRIMDADLAVVREKYDRACVLAYAGGVEDHSWAPAEQFWTALRAAFPSAEFTIDHQIGRDDPMLGARAALRWSLHGRHDGWGAFGAPSGAEVYVMGFCHAEFGPWGLRRECVLYDECAIWKQILMHKG